MKFFFSSPCHFPMFLDYLNSHHTNIKFTSELERDGKALPFLDVEVTKVDNTFSTSVYRKPMSTSLMTRSDSFILLQYKQNLVLSLATRAYRICSNYFNLHNEFQFLRGLLTNKGFPSSFIDKYIGIHLGKVKLPPKAITSVNQAVLYFPIPYLGKRSLTLRKKVQCLMQEFYPQIPISANHI